MSESESEGPSPIDLVNAIISSHEVTERGFKTLSAKMEGVDAKMEGVDAKIEGVDAKIEGVEAKLEGLNTKLEGRTVLLKSDMN